MEKIKPKNNTPKQNGQDLDYVCICDKHYGEKISKWKLKHRCIPEDCPWRRTSEEFQNVNIHFVGD